MSDTTIRHGKNDFSITQNFHADLQSQVILLLQKRKS